MSLKLSKMQEGKLKGLLGRAFTKKQVLILQSICGRRTESITSTTKKISDERKIPLSTVKLDFKIFEQLGLIRTHEIQGFKKPSMTKFGKVILHLLSDYNKIKKSIEWPLFKILHIYLPLIKIEFKVLL